MPAASTREGERRQHDRALVDIRVDLSPDVTARFVSCRARNVSEGGFFLATDALLHPGAEARLGFLADDGELPIRCAARVVWVREEPQGDDRPPGLGLEFLAFQEDGAARVSRWCRSLRDTQPLAVPPPVPARLEVVAPDGDDRREEVFDGTGVFLARGRDETPPGVRTDVFVLAELDITAPRRRRPGVRWLVAALVLAALGAAGWWFRAELSELAASLGDRLAGARSPAPDAQVPTDAAAPGGLVVSHGDADREETEPWPADLDAGEATTPVADEADGPSVGTADELAARPAEPTAGQPDAAAAEGAGEPPTAAADDPLPRPAEEAAEETSATAEVEADTPPTAPPEAVGPSPPAAGPLLETVSWQEAGDTTVVLLRLSAPIEPGRATVQPLVAPDRLLVKLAGVGVGAGVAPIEVAGPRVASIRSAFHRERTPPELHVVLDLSTPGLKALDWSVDGATVKIVVGAP